MSALDDYLSFYKEISEQPLPCMMTATDKDSLCRERHLQSYGGSVRDYPVFYEGLGVSPYSLTDYLIPEPFCGDVKNSKIFFINYNPKLSGSEFIEQSNDLLYKNNLIEVLQQKLDSDYPFFALNPKYNGKAAYQWWKNKLDQRDPNKSLLNNISRETGKDLSDVYMDFSKIFCNIETVPYHSKNFNAGSGWISHLDATRVTLNFIHNYLIPKANEKEILVLIRSGVKRISKNAGFGEIKESSNVHLLTLNMNISFGIGTNLGQQISKYILDNHLI